MGRDALTDDKIHHVIETVSVTFGVRTTIHVTVFRCNVFGVSHTRESFITILLRVAFSSLTLLVGHQLYEWHFLHWFHRLTTLIIHHPFTLSLQA